MVHESLEYYRNDLHALLLKLQTQLYTHLACKLIHLSLHRRASMQDRRPGGEQAEGNWRYVDCLVEIYAIFMRISRKYLFLHLHLSVYQDMQKLTQSFKDTES